VSNEAAGILLCPLKKKFQALQPYSAKAVHEQETEMALYKNMFIERSSEAIPSEIARSAKELSCYIRQQELDVLAGCSSLSVQKSNSGPHFSVTAEKLCPSELQKGLERPVQNRTVIRRRT